MSFHVPKSLYACVSGVVECVVHRIIVKGSLVPRVSKRPKTEAGIGDLLRGSVDSVDLYYIWKFTYQIRVLTW